VTSITLHLPKRHDAQTTVVTGKRRWNAVVCGRRWGKTTLGLDLLIVEPGGALDGHPVAWFAPNSKTFAEVWQEAKTLLREVTSRVDSQQHVIELITGGRIDFWTLHNTDDPGRGRKYARIVIDEAAIVPSHRLRRQWQEAIRPTLTDLRGDAWFFSTPKGAGFFQDLYQHAVEADDWSAWRMPTTANPHIDPAEVEDARAELPGPVFRQEYLAEFVTEFGTVFKPATTYTPRDLPEEHYTEATGCDFAYTSKSGDWTVFLTGRKGDDGIIYITDLYREQAEATTWADRLRHAPRPFAYIGGQEAGITAFLAKDYDIGIRTERATSDKLARAMPASAAWNRGEIRLPAGSPITTEIEAEVLAFTGNPRHDEHDDIVDALAALHAHLDVTHATGRTVRVPSSRASLLGGRRSA
jgi:phage terminase large subunit-like protein